MNEQSFQIAWWNTDKKRSHNALWATVEAIANNNTYRDQANLRFARLYGNADIVGLGSGEYYRTTQPWANSGSRLTYNVIKSMVDTVSAKIAKNKPKPMFLTNDGDWDLQQKAQKLNQWAQGVLYETEAYRLGPVAFRDACIWGNGVIKIFQANGRIKMERVLLSELRVDQTESIHGKPQTLYQTKPVNRDRLLAMFPKEEDQVAIKNAPNAALNAGDSTTVADTVEVVEGWRLASGPKKKDGMHIISIKSHTLLQEEYSRTCFPFVTFRWTEPLIGWYGIGLAEELIGIQLEINRLLRQIQLSHQLLSTPKVLLENGAQIVSSHLNNEIGAIIKYTGTAPQIVSFQTVHPEIYQHLERLYQRAFEIAGVSQLSATGKKPAGLDAAVALREYQEIETERFALQQQRYEEFFLDIIQHCIELAKEIVSEKGTYTVKSPNKKVIEQIDFKDLNPEDSTYVMQCFPTNFLPATPAGKLQSVQELLNAGLITPEVGLSLLNYPDLEAAMSLANAPVDCVMMHLTAIIEEDKYMPPEPYYNLDIAEKLSQSVYLKCKVDGMPEEKLEMIQRFINEVQLLKNVAQQGMVEMQQQQQAQLEPATAVLPTAGTSG